MSSSATLVVTAAIIENDGKILLTRRKPEKPFGGLWEFPGGKVEEGEDPKKCIVREIEEELAISVAVTSVYDTVYYRYPGKNVLLLAYRCAWLAGVPQNIDVAEHIWVSAGELRSFELLAADMPLVERLVRERA